MREHLGYFYKRKFRNTNQNRNKTETVPLSERKKKIQDLEKKIKIKIKIIIIKKKIIKHQDVSIANILIIEKKTVNTKIKTTDIFSSVPTVPYHVIQWKLYTSRKETKEKMNLIQKSNKKMSCYHFNMPFLV